jgi:ABC-type Na+ transport system ATPase subunit NatA
VLGTAPGDPAALARIGMLVESPAFYPYLSGRDNLRVFARYASVPVAKVDKVLETVDLADRAKGHASSCSLGMKQRLGVVAALLKDPIVFSDAAARAHHQTKLEMLKKVTDTVEGSYRSGETQVFLREQR